MNKIIFSITFLFSFGIADEQVSLSLLPISTTQIEVYMTNSVSVSAFQFDLSNIELLEGSNGLAGENGWDVSVAPIDETTASRVIGLAIFNPVIEINLAPTLLTILSFTQPIVNNTICLNFNLNPDDVLGGAVSNVDGVAIPTELGDCISFEGCNEANAENTSSYAIFDDGSCSCYDADCLDCAGNAGGEAVVDCSGECGGLAEYDCTYDATDESTWVDACGGNAVDDDCGECDSNEDNNGDSCLPVEIQFSDVIISDSLLSIQLTNSQTIKNISFKLSGITNIELLSSNDSFSQSTIIDTLISFSNGSLSPETHTLLSLKYIPLTTTSCVSEVSIFGDGLHALEVIINECADIAIIGCTDETSCNYDSNATLSSDDCTYPIENYDCDGSCAGNLIEDECGLCGGSGPIQNYDCLGDCQSEIDDCGVCGGDNSLCISSDTNYLLLSRISTLPDEGEFITIKNTSDVDVNLKNHYISDDKEYFKIQSESKEEVNLNDFIGRFPDDSLIVAGGSINICLSSQYSSFLPSSFVCDYILQEDLENIFTDGNSFGESAGERLSESQEMIVLFYWDGDLNHPVRDIDYFVWGNQSSSMYKANTPLYYTETLPEAQDIFVESLTEYYSYVRSSNDELEVIGFNGYLGQDETSEAFNSTWGINITDGFNLFEEIMEGNFDCSIDSREACEDGTQSSDAAENCPLVNIEGMLVNFGDYTLKDGPYALILEDDDGFRLELTIWDNTWDIKIDNDYSILTVPPFHDFKVKATGNVYTYNGNRQVYVCGPNEIEITESYNLNGVQDEFETNRVSINPVPFVIIPELNENLNFTYTFPNNSRVIINIFDLSGRFITSLEDSFFEDGGTVYRDNIMQNEPGEPINASAWDGRDQLGQIVSPGTYIMHLEVFNPATGETRTDAAPIVVGVKN